MPHKICQPPAQSCCGQSQGSHFFSRRQERVGFGFLSYGDTPDPKLLLILLSWPGTPESSGSQCHKGGFICPDLGNTHGLGLQATSDRPMLLWCPPDLLEEESPLQDALSPPLT